MHKDTGKKAFSTYMQHWTAEMINLGPHHTPDLDTFPLLENNIAFIGEKHTDT